MRALNTSKPCRRAFTVMELMLVIGVILVLLSIILPTMSHMKKAATKTAARAQLDALRQGLASYFQDFGMYPPSSPIVPGTTSTLVYPNAIKAGRGSEMLAEGLIGYLDSNFDGGGAPLDGVVGQVSTNGFRINKNAAAMGGKIYGPYASVDPKQLKVSPLTNQQYFIDPWGNEILYFRSNAPVPIPNVKVTKIFDTTANIAKASTTGTIAYFAVEDCSKDWQNGSIGPNLNSNPPAASSAFYSTLGNGPDPAVKTATNNVYGPINGGDSFLLISAGPDGIYFNADDIVMGSKE
jgi:type II secretory pathway pseudopilin PulG